MVKFPYIYIYIGVYIYVYVVDATSTIVAAFVSGFVFDFKTKRRIFSFLDKKG